MENNQEHKIDKIFRDSLENQSFIPPVNAWMAVHTYTIGQEEKKPKVWLKYASLALLLLLISGFGLWYIIDNQIFASRDTLKLHSYEVVSEDTDHGEKNAGRVQNPASVKTTDQIFYRTKIIQTKSVKFIPTFSEKILGHSNFSETQNHEIKPLITEKVEDSSVNENIVPISFFKDIEIKEIENKPLILNDLSDKMQKEKEEKVVVLGEKTEDKQKVYKADSVEYGNKFSLKHPIIEVNLLSYTQTSWTTAGDLPKNIFNSDGNFENLYFRIGISWKINKKIRAGVSLSMLNNSYDLTKNNGSSKGNIFNLESINGNDYYTAKTIYGNISIPVTDFKFADAIKNPQSGVVNLTYFDAKPPLGFPSNEFITTGIDYFNSKSSQIGVNMEYDIFSKDVIPKKKNGYQFYAKGEINLQLIRNYGTFASFGTIKNGSDEKLYSLYRDLTFLEHKSDKILAGRLGLGARWILGRKFDFYIEAYQQRSITSWVSGLSFNTYQNTTGYQFGFHINL